MKKLMKMATVFWPKNGQGFFPKFEEKPNHLFKKKQIL
jgi:hypothetical protein